MNVASEGSSTHLENLFYGFGRLKRCYFSMIQAFFFELKSMTSSHCHFGSPLQVTPIPRNYSCTDRCQGLFPANATGPAHLVLPTPPLGTQRAVGRGKCFPSPVSGLRRSLKTNSMCFYIIHISKLLRDVNMWKRPLLQIKTKLRNTSQ